VLGGYVGDAAGATLEFKVRVSEAEAAEAMELRGGGPHNVGPGQVTDDSEMDMALVRALDGCDGCDASEDADAEVRRRAAAGYIAWHRSEPFDVGQTVGRAFAFARCASECEANAARYSALSEANGALMRVAPLAVWWAASRARAGAGGAGGAGDDADAGDARLAELARADARLSHPSAVCQAANAAYCVALARVLATPAGVEPDREGAVAAALLHATASSGGAPAPAPAPVPEVVRWIEQESAQALGEIQGRCGAHVGHVRHALALAFHFLRRPRAPYAAALLATLRAGGDTDTNAKIVGNLVGALDPGGLPPAAAAAVLGFDCASGRARRDLLGHARPAAYRAADAVALVAGWAAGPRGLNAASKSAQI
jgi:ADP-ribosylglycohydrolase